MKTSHAVRRLSAIAALALCACATEPKPPSDALRDSANAIASAEDARAADYAAPEMRSAHEKLAAARALAQQATPDKNDSNSMKARWLAEEASADAALAEAKARNVRTQSVLRHRRAVPCRRRPPRPAAARSPRPPIRPTAPARPMGVSA